MIHPDEILKNSSNAGKEELKELVYTEYLQCLIVKYVNDFDGNKSSRKPYYLFGPFLHRIYFGMNRYGNTVDFLTENKSIIDYAVLNNHIEDKLESEGYSVDVKKLDKYKYSFEISSDSLFNYSEYKYETFKVNLNYYPIAAYFIPKVFNTSTEFLLLKAFDVNTHLNIICTQLSLSVLLRVMFVRKSIEPIELYDLYKLSTSYMQMCEHDFFKFNELKNIKKTIMKAKTKLGSKKIKAVKSKNFYIIDNFQLIDFFNFKKWVDHINI